MSYTYVTCSLATAAGSTAMASASSKLLYYAKAVGVQTVFIHADHATDHTLPSSRGTKKSYISSVPGITIDTVVSISKY
jgi:hypothetical protein